MRSRSLMLVVAAALTVQVFAMLVVAPSAFAQDDNPRGDDPGGGGTKGGYDGVYLYNDNPTGGDAIASPSATASASASATATPTSSATSTPGATSTATSTASASASATATSGGSASAGASALPASALPNSGGVPVLSVAVGILLVSAGVVAAMLTRRTS